MSRLRGFGLALLLSAVAAVPACGSDDAPVFPKPLPPGVDPTFEPVAGGMRKLIGIEYSRSVELLLGANAAAAAAPPDDIGQEGFDMIGATILPLSTAPVELYELSADIVAATAVSNPSTMAETAPCVTTGGAGCFEEVATNLGRMFYRRPLIQEEIEELVEVAEFAQNWAMSEPTLDPFEQGLKYQLMAMLQSPNFIYVQELGELDADLGYYALNQHELASRLSFFLLARTPDAALLDMADNGELGTPEALKGLALELLSSDDAWPALASFYDELYRLRFLEEGTPKNAQTFPSWTPELARDMRTETLLFLQEVVWKSEGNMMNMYDAPFTFLNDSLAAHYGVTPPGNGTQFVKTNWPTSQNRAGVTSQGSFLAHQSGPLRNSPTKRGKFVLTFLMCKNVPPPPDNVVPELPDDPNAELTLQELLEQHMEDPACNTCHGVTDPVGFAFEHFDSIGRARTTDETGKAIDGYGTIPEFNGEWENAEDLALLLAQAPDAATCIIQNFIRGRLGHTETDGEDPAIARLDTSFVESEYKLRELLAEFTANQLFRYVGEAK